MASDRASPEPFTMGTDSPALYLPPIFDDDTIQALLTSLGLPEAQMIGYCKGYPVYHSVYSLTFHAIHYELLEPAKKRHPDGSASLILRVSGKHLPRIKTINEVSVMRWVRENTTIPVPAVVRFDASEENILGHEFTLLEFTSGRPLFRVWNQLDATTKHSVISQITGYQAQIHAHPFELIGGMQFSEADGSIVPGPVLDEAFWQAPNVAEYWPAGESVSTLNISGPYESYTALCAAQVERVIYAIGKHDSLAWCEDLVPRLQAFVDMLSNDRERVRDMKLNDVKIVLAHRTVPAPIWNASNQFLWKGRNRDLPDAEQRAVIAIFEQICAERGIKVLEDAKTNENQETMQKIVTLMHDIVQVCPRGKRQDEAEEWKQEVEEALSELEIPI